MKENPPLKHLSKNALIRKLKYQISISRRHETKVYTLNYTIRNMKRRLINITSQINYIVSNPTGISIGRRIRKSD